jgi:hypothetical protein
MFRVVDSKQAKRLPNFLLLVGCYTVLFGEFGGALCNGRCS